MVGRGGGRELDENISGWRTKSGGKGSGTASCCSGGKNKDGRE